MPLKNNYPDSFLGANSFFPVIYFYDLLTAPVDITNAVYVVSGELYFNGSKFNFDPSLWQLVGGSGPDIYYQAGNVGIGLSNPNYQLEVTGNAKFNNSVIISNAQTVSLQDTLGGLTANIKRNTDNTLTIENTTTDKDIYI